MCDLCMLMETMTDEQVYAYRGWMASIPGGAWIQRLEFDYPDPEELATITFHFLLPDDVGTRVILRVEPTGAATTVIAGRA